MIPISPLRSRASFILISGLENLLSGLKKLISSIGWSFLVVRPFQKNDYPYKEDYLEMITETGMDVNTISSLIPQMTQQGLSIVNFGEGQRISLKEDLLEVIQELDTLEATINAEVRSRFIGVGEFEDVAREQVQSFVENFANDTYIDHDKSSNILLIPDGECVTLSRQADLDLALSAKQSIDILDGSGVLLGLPGNTCEVEIPQNSIVPGDSTPEVTFLGETDTHSDPIVMFDSTPDTWFEFERCSLDTMTSVILDEPKQKVPAVVQRANNLRTKAPVLTASPYIQPLSKIGQAYFYDTSAGKPTDIFKVISPDLWTITATEGDVHTTTQKIGIPKDNTLVLSILMELAEPRILNYLELDPYIPVGAKDYTLDSITLYPAITENSQAEIKTITPTLVPDRVVITLPYLVKIAKVKIVLKQTTPYTTSIGHPFILATVNEQTKKSFLFMTYSNKNKTIYQRLKNEDEALSLDYYKNRDLTVVGAVLGAGVAIAMGAQIALSVFLGPAAIIGWVVMSLFGKSTTRTVKNVARGVDVFLGKRWQIGIRDLALKQFHYDQSGKLVSKAFNFKQPVQTCSFIPKDESHEGLTTLRYFLSPDNGTTWYENSTIVTFDAPTTSVLVQVLLERRAVDVDDEILTPRLNGYELKGYAA